MKIGLIDYVTVPYGKTGTMTTFFDESGKVVEQRYGDYHVCIHYGDSICVKCGKDHNDKD